MSGRERSAVGCLALLWLALVMPSGALAQSAPIQTYANPLDIDYRYNFEHMNQGISYRSGADPVIVPHRGEYYLFLTVSGGYWRSKDLLHWSYVTPTRWPFEDIVAPAALSVRDTLYLLQSTTVPRPILFSTAPEMGRLEFYHRLLPSPPGALSPWNEPPATPKGSGIDYPRDARTLELYHEATGKAPAELGLRQ